MDKNMMWVETLWNPLNEKKKSLMDDKQSLIRVAAYCRVSPGRDTYVHSLINQINHFTFFIRSKPNWKFSGIYYDKGLVQLILIIEWTKKVIAPCKRRSY